MSEHLEEMQARRLAASHAIDHAAGRETSWPPHLAECERCAAAVLVQLRMLGAVTRHAETLVPGPRPRRPGRSLAAAAACILLGLGGWALLQRAGSPAGFADLPLAIAPLPEPVPMAIHLHPRPAAPPAADRRPGSSLRVSGLRSAPFALGLPGLGSRPYEVEIDGETFRTRVLARLDPRDQWRVHQQTLAEMGLYPRDRVDGLYGPATRAALDQFSRERGLAPLKPRHGLLPHDASGTLLAGIETVTVRATGGEARTAGRAEETHSDAGGLGPRPASR
jgi:hypothetical protein